MLGPNYDSGPTDKEPEWLGMTRTITLNYTSIKLFCPPDEVHPTVFSYKCAEFKFDNFFKEIADSREGHLLD